MSQSLFGVGEDVLAHILSTFLNAKSLVKFAIAYGYHTNWPRGATKRLLLQHVYFDLNDAERITSSSMYLMNRAFHVKSITLDFGKAIFLNLRGERICQRRMAPWVQNLTYLVPEMRPFRLDENADHPEEIIEHSAIIDPLEIDSLSNASERRTRITHRIPFLLPFLSNLEGVEIWINECQTAMDKFTIVNLFDNLTMMFDGGFCQKVCHIKVRFGNEKNSIPLNLFKVQVL